MMRASGQQKRGEYLQKLDANVPPSNSSSKGAIPAIINKLLVGQVASFSSTELLPANLENFSVKVRWVDFARGEKINPELGATLAPIMSFLPLYVVNTALPVFNSTTFPSELDPLVGNNQCQIAAGCTLSAFSEPATARIQQEAALLADIGRRILDEVPSLMLPKEHKKTALQFTTATVSQLNRLSYDLCESSVKLVLAKLLTEIRNDDFTTTPDKWTGKTDYQKFRALFVSATGRECSTSQAQNMVDHFQSLYASLCFRHTLELASRQTQYKDLAALLENGFYFLGKNSVVSLPILFATQVALEQMKLDGTPVELRSIRMQNQKFVDVISIFFRFSQDTQSFVEVSESSISSQEGHLIIEGYREHPNHSYDLTTYRNELIKLGPDFILTRATAHHSQFPTHDPLKSFETLAQSALATGMTPSTPTHASKPLSQDERTLLQNYVNELSRQAQEAETHNLVSGPDALLVVKHVHLGSQTLLNTVRSLT